MAIKSISTGNVLCTKWDDDEILTALKKLFYFYLDQFRTEF